MRDTPKRDGGPGALLGLRCSWCGTDAEDHGVACIAAEHGIILAAMLDTKLFGAACIGVVTVAICYVAGMNDWRLIALPLLVVLAYHLVFPKRP